MSEARALTWVGERLRPDGDGKGRRRRGHVRWTWVQTATFGDAGRATRWLVEGNPGDRRLVVNSHRLGLPDELRDGRPPQFRLRKKTTVTDTLYARLGADHGIRAAVDDFYDRVLGDGELVGYFERLSEQGLAQLRWHMVAFLAAATGGPANYAGRDLGAAHGHLAIRPEHFDRVAAHLVATLRGFDVADADVVAVEAAVVALKTQIVST